MFGFRVNTIVFSSAFNSQLDSFDNDATVCNCDEGHWDMALLLKPSLKPPPNSLTNRKGLGPRILESQYLMRALRLKSENMAMCLLSKMSLRVRMLNSGELGKFVFSNDEQHSQLKIVQSGSIYDISLRIREIIGLRLFIPRNYSLKSSRLS
jgi:hypothetical protein